MRLSQNQWLRIAVVIFGGTVINIWGLEWVPFHKLPVTPFWEALIVRGTQALLSLIMIRLFCPGALRRFRWGGRPKELLISLGVVVFLVSSPILHINFHHVGFGAILEAFIFSLFIGIDEDFFSRGFMYGALEKYGLWFAAIVSSVQFGLLHLGNIAWGHQSAAFTIAQAVGAGAFGLLAVALMIYSGSIWVPILLHGLTDFPMQFDTAHEYTAIVTGGADWIGVITDVITYCAIAWVLICLSDPVRKEQLMEFGRKMKLVEG